MEVFPTNGGTLVQRVCILLKNAGLKAPLARLLGALKVSMLAGETPHQLGDETWLKIECDVPEGMAHDLMAVFAHCVIFDAVVEPTQPS